MVLDALELRRQRGKRRGRHHAGGDAKRQQRTDDKGSRGRAWRRPLPLPARGAGARAQWADCRRWRCAREERPLLSGRGGGRSGPSSAGQVGLLAGPWSPTRLLRGSLVFETHPTAAVRRARETSGRPRVTRAQPGKRRPDPGSGGPSGSARTSPSLPLPLARQPREPCRPYPWRWSCM